MLSLQTTRTTKEEQRQQDRGFKHVGAPALSLGLDAIAFGPGPAAVKALFKIDPLFFRGMNIPKGIEFPNLKNRLVDIRLKEVAERLQAA